MIYLIAFLIIISTFYSVFNRENKTSGLISFKHDGDYHDDILDIICPESKEKQK
jgi:hypothetical protein